MAKKIFDLKNVKKVVIIITIKCLIISLANIALLLIPINNTTCFEFFELLFEGAIKLDFSSVSRIIYYLLTILIVICFSCGILFKRKKSEINTSSISAIKNSAFAKIIIMDILYLVSSMFLSGTYYCINLPFASNDYSFFKGNVAYIIYCISVEFILIVLEISFVRIINPARNFVNFGAYAKPNTNDLSETCNQANTDSCNNIKSKHIKKTALEKKQDLDALAKYKKLYDSEAITHEEFLKKKTELLDE